MKNISFQMLGTGIAQLLPFAVTPVLTRIFSEKDFALYTSFFAVATVLNVVVGARYQYAIVIPKEDTKALRIFSLSIYITLVFVLILQLLVLVLPSNNFLQIGRAIYLLPVYVLFFGIWSSFSNLSIRFKQFKNNAIAKVFQSFFYILSSIGFGLLKFTLYGLIAGKILGLLSSWSFLLKKSNIKLKVVRLNKLRKVAREYIDYPKYGIFPAFLNTLSTQAIVLVLAKFYSTDDLGYFGLTTLVLSAPLGLIGASFKDVFYQKIAYLINNSKDFDGALSFFKKSSLALFVIGIPVCLIIYFFGPTIFSFVFGDKWDKSGVFASILAMSFLVKLVVSPLSSVFNATNKLKVASVWQTLYFVTTFSTLGVCSYFLKLDIENLFLVYVIHECVLYSIYFLLQYDTMRRLKKNNVI